jgi:hypothetical protein
MFIRTVIPFSSFWCVLYALFRFMIDHCLRSLLSSRNKTSLTCGGRRELQQGILHGECSQDSAIIVARNYKITITLFWNRFQNAFLTSSWNMKQLVSAHLKHLISVNFLTIISFSAWKFLNRGLSHGTNSVLRVFNILIQFWLLESVMAIFERNYSKSKSRYDWRCQSVSQCVLVLSPLLVFMTRCLLLFDCYCRVFVGCPLWREVGSAVCHSESAIFSRLSVHTSVFTFHMFNTESPVHTLYTSLCQSVFSTAIYALSIVV